MVGLVPLISCDTLSISNTVGRREGCSINIDADHQLYSWGVLIAYRLDVVYVANKLDIGGTSI
jgi:hypothetical protein